jgi:hypothetical protein
LGQDHGALPRTYPDVMNGKNFNQECGKYMDDREENCINEKMERAANGKIFQWSDLKVRPSLIYEFIVAASGPAIRYFLQV